MEQYQIANQAVCQLLVDYLQRRSHDLDYSIAGHPGDHADLTFWKTIERVNPEPADLRLSEETYQAWRSAIRTREDGKPRTNQDGVLLAVRALYFDIQAWAAAEPERWAAWVSALPGAVREIRAA